jgi:hypothetical protein
MCFASDRPRLQPGTLYPIIWRQAQIPRPFSKVAEHRPSRGRTCPRLDDEVIVALERGHLIPYFERISLRTGCVVSAAASRFATAAEDDAFVI